MLYSTHYQSPLGEIILTGDDHSINGVYFRDQKHFPKKLPKLRSSASGNSALEAAIQQLKDYFNGQSLNFELPLQPLGTEFQQLVWQALLKIPAGTTCTYRQLAERIGKPTASRAVAAAIGRNPISIIIPCHRVIGSNGSLTGYAGGVERKQALLTMEAKVD